MKYIPHFDDLQNIEGQGTVSVEIVEDLPEVDAIILPIGGGGLSSGVSFHMRKYSPTTKLYGVEPEGAPSMQAALQNGGPIALDQINKFVDGAAVKKIGQLT